MTTVSTPLIMKTRASRPLGPLKEAVLQVPSTEPNSNNNDNNKHNNDNMINLQHQDPVQQ